LRWLDGDWRFAQSFFGARMRANFHWPGSAGPDNKSRPPCVLCETLATFALNLLLSVRAARRPLSPALKGREKLTR
jgi:hypothetical protein